MAESTKERILAQALRLFSQSGFDAVSVEQIAAAVGIKAPSLYKHYKSKQAIFEALFEEARRRYSDYTLGISVHLTDAEQDTEHFTQITQGALADKVKRLVEFSLRDEFVSGFRRMLTVEQFRSSELAALYTKRYVTMLVDYHAELFKQLIAAGTLCDRGAQQMALMYVAPVIVLVGVCDRQPEREQECMGLIDAHVKLFFETYNIPFNTNKTEE